MVGSLSLAVQTNPVFAGGKTMESKRLLSVSFSVYLMLLLAGLALGQSETPSSASEVAPLPADLVDPQYPPLEGLAPGSQEAQERQRQAVQQLGLPVEVRTRVTGIVLRLIPSGTFTMGSPVTEAGRDGDEAQYEVTLTRAFYCGKFEVTQAQWEAVMGSNPSRCQNAGPAAPVERVSWDDCQEFLKRLCQMESVAEGTYRLLTEAEWEYACRAGTQTPFCYGNDLDSTMANFAGAYPYGAGSKGITWGTALAVGSFRANAWGLYDMHGNVEEWCGDWYADACEGGPQTDPLGPASGEERVVRSGCWINSAGNLRSAFRRDSPPDFRLDHLGFRLARITPSDP
jgi:formylglycine-generating enzyme required for sulfatase activity